MILSRRLLVMVSAGAVVGCVLAGCSKASKPTSASSAPMVSGGSAAVSPTASAPGVSPSEASSPAATEPASFDGTCDSLIPVTTVNAALGRLVVGKTAFVVGVAEPDIGRLTYLNCRYGIPAAVKGKPAPTPTVEITASLYGTAAQATSRVQATIESYLSNGAAQVNATVGGYPMTVLTGYHDPTAVASSGQRTVAVTVVKSLLTSTPATGLTALAKAVLDATANVTGGTAAASAPVSSAPVSPAPSGPSAIGSPAAS